MGVATPQPSRIDAPDTNTLTQGRPSPMPMTHIAYSPISTKCINYPLFSTKIYKFLPTFVHFAFWLNLRLFASPYYDHDAFTHLVLHVLDVPAITYLVICMPESRI